MSAVETERHPGGRPTKFTEAKAERIISLLRTGALPETAAAAGGVSRRTFFNWLKQGSDDLDAGLETTLAEFVHSITRARAEAEVSALTQITLAGQGLTDDKGRVIRPGDWRALAWRLERTNPEVYGNRQRVDVTQNDGESDDERRRRAYAQLMDVRDSEDDKDPIAAMYGVTPQPKDSGAAGD